MVADSEAAEGSGGNANSQVKRVHLVVRPQILRKTSPHEEALSPQALLFHRDAVGDLVVLVPRNDVPLKEFVLTGVWTPGDDAIGGSIVQARQA